MYQYPNKNGLPQRNRTSDLAKPFSLIAYQALASMSGSPTSRLFLFDFYLDCSHFTRFRVFCQGFFGVFLEGIALYSNVARSATIERRVAEAPRG